jgi:hypothetical protein
MAETSKEAVLTLLLIECIRRLSKNGKAPIHITNHQLEKNYLEGLEVDYSKSNKDKFILRLNKEEEIVLEENVEVVKEDVAEEGSD